ncbi:MAG: hypothetical protein WAU88_03165, partial [Candidatus Zixiibacteriota bacterium]
PVHHGSIEMINEDGGRKMCDNAEIHDYERSFLGVIDNHVRDQESQPAKFRQLGRAAEISA